MFEKATGMSFEVLERVSVALALADVGFSDFCFICSGESRVIHDRAGASGHFPSSIPPGLMLVALGSLVPTILR